MTAQLSIKSVQRLAKIIVRRDGDIQSFHFNVHWGIMLLETGHVAPYVAQCMEGLTLQGLSCSSFFLGGGVG